MRRGKGSKLFEVSIVEDKKHEPTPLNYARPIPREIDVGSEERIQRMGGSIFLRICISCILIVLAMLLRSILSMVLVIAAAFILCSAIRSWYGSESW